MLKMPDPNPLRWLEMLVASIFSMILALIRMVYTSISVEELYSRLSEADIFINRGMPKYGPDIKSITDQAPVLADLEIFNNGNIWQITDSYWSNYNDIDEKYIELAAIFHPELYPEQEFENFVQMPGSS